MPQERSHFGLWFRRNWFLASIVAFAVVLALIQLWLQWAFHPPLVIMGIAGAVSIAGLFGFVLALLYIRRPLADLRYRWLTRDVDRAIKHRDRKFKRPAAERSL